MDNTKSKLNKLATLIMVMLVGTVSISAFVGGAAAAPTQVGSTGGHSGGVFSDDYTTEATWDGVELTNGTTKTFEVHGVDVDISEVTASDITMEVDGAQVTPDGIRKNNGVLYVDYTPSATSTSTVRLVVNKLTVNADTEVHMSVNNTGFAINVDKVHHDISVQSQDGTGTSLNGDFTANANSGASYDNRTNVSNPTFTIVEGNSYDITVNTAGYGSIQGDNTVSITDVVNASNTYAVTQYEQVSKTLNVDQPDGTDVQDGGDVWVWYDSDNANYHYQTTVNGSVTISNFEANHANYTVNIVDYVNESENNTQDYQAFQAQYDNLSGIPTNYTLENWRTVTVNVQDVNGNNISTGTVTIANSYKGYSKTVNVSNGTATFNNVSDSEDYGLQDGNYKITVNVDGYDSVSRYAEVTSDTETTAKLAETGAKDSSYFVGVGESNGGGLIGGSFNLPSQVPDFIEHPVENLVNGIMDSINNMLSNGIMNEVDNLIKSVQDALNYQGSTA